jgi:hypothetical protein
VKQQFLANLVLRRCRKAFHFRNRFLKCAGHTRRIIAHDRFL